MWETPPHSYDDPKYVQTCTHFPWWTESPWLCIPALCWLDGYIKVFFFFFMAEATTTILFKMSPLLMKIQWGQEVYTQNGEGLGVRKRKRLCEWGWGNHKAGNLGVGLQSMGPLRVGRDWATSLSLFTFTHWRRKWQPTPVFLPGESQGQGSLVGCRLWGHTESDTTEAT